MNTTTWAVALLPLVLAACAGPKARPAEPPTAVESTKMEEVRFDVTDVNPTLPGSDAESVPALPPHADTGMVVQQAERRVRADFPRLRKCYDDAFLANRNLAGTVALRFTLIPSGQISQPRDSGSTIQDHDVVDCVANVLIRTKFDKFDGPGVELYVPLRFDPPRARTAQSLF